MLKRLKISSRIVMIKFELLNQSPVLSLSLMIVIDQLDVNLCDRLARIEEVRKGQGSHFLHEAGPG